MQYYIKFLQKSAVFFYLVLNTIDMAHLDIVIYIISIVFLLFHVDFFWGGESPGAGGDGFQIGI